MAQSALIQDFVIPVTDDVLSGMIPFTLMLRGHENGIVALVLSETTVRNYGSWSFEEAPTFADKEAELTVRYPNIFARAQSIKRMWSGRRYTLVDSAYVPDDGAAVLKMVTGGIGEETSVLQEPIFGTYSAIFNAPDSCQWIFNAAFFQRLGKVCSGKPSAFFFADGPYATLHVYDGKQWVLSVPYMALEVQDASYFILYAMEELGIDAESLRLFYAGFGFNAQDITEVLERFVAKVAPLRQSHWNVNHELAAHAVALEAFTYHAHH